MTLVEATILIVDDEPQLLTIFGSWFKREGCRILLAENGAEGLKLASQNRVDLVISDIRMPVMSGIELAQRLGKHPGSMPQMLFVSSAGEIEDRELYDLGVARMLHKPIGRQKLVEAARLCLLDKDKRWSTPPNPDEGTIRDLVSQASEPPSDRIAFGRGGLCLCSNANLQKGHLVRVNLTSELDAPASIVATVQWVAPQHWLSGLEIRYVDQIGRASVIRVTDNAGVNAFIPRTVGPR